MKSKRNYHLPFRHYLKTAFGLMLLFSVMKTDQLNAQNQYQQWAFGSNASYSFIPATGPLTPAPAINTLESAASWCNGAGNLWFYTNGRDIYNTQIPAGPLNPGLGWYDGNPNNTSAIQGALILPGYQGAADRFHIFTVSDRGTTNTGLVWDCYDATTHTSCGGTWLGFVPSRQGSFTTEGLTAARHANGTDFWVIVKPVIFPVGTVGAVINSSHPSNPVSGGLNTSVYAYLVTSAGPSATPVISNAGFGSDFIGGVNLQQEIKCSPDGKLVAITNRISPTLGNIMLYSFDNSTGQMQLLQTLPMTTGYSPWSISFSPNSKVLYATGLINASDGEVLRQFDLANLFCALSTQVPFCDYYTTVPFPGSQYSKLQLTPDNRIFRTRRGSSYVDVITNPNLVPCINMGYQAEAVLVSNSSGTPQNSLPNNIDAFSPSNITPQNSDWPKSTVNTVINDRATMVDLDQFGDIYSAGEFRQSTQFQNVTITGMSSGSVYLTKYDNCSGLEWVAKGVPLSPNGTVTCTSMNVGTSSGFVMMTGRYSGQVTFSSAITPALTSVCASSQTISGAGIYIAVYDYSGCLKSVQTILNNATYTHVSSHITQSRALFSTGNQNRVHVAINETTTTVNKVQVFAFAVNASGILSGGWTAPIRSSGTAVVNDIGSFKNTVAVTGTFQRDVAWNTSAIFASGATGVNEAFVLTVNEVSPITQPSTISALTKGFDPALGTSTSSGTGVNVFSSSDIALTGFYTGVPASTFETTLGMAGNGAYSCGYAVRMNSTASASNWVRSLLSNNGHVRGADVSFANNFVYLTGTWEGNGTFGINGTVFPTAVPLKLHLYAVKMESNGNYTSAACWRNHSYTNDDLTEYMRPARIAANTDYVYINGVYKGTGQMENDIAANSPLTATVNTFNSFVWRYRAGTGLSLREGVAAEDAGQTTAITSPQVFPNPVEQTLNISFDSDTESESKIEVYNLSGQLIYSAVSFSNRSEIAVAEWPSGIYLLRVIRNGEVFTEKIIRE
jgi:Secretion system C-terminal sorting domain